MGVFNPCPATGRINHWFDPATHRCKCGRWERGYKPKVEPTRPRAECPICEGTFALDGNGHLGHHGYKRPGWGFIIGDCMAVGYKPWPDTIALKKYLAAVIAHREVTVKTLKSLPKVKGLPYSFSRSFEGSRDRVKVEISILRGAEREFNFELYGRSGVAIPSFAYRENLERGNLEVEIEHTEKERERIENRIKAAEALNSAVA